MGQARIRQEALRSRALELGKKWDFPPSQWEADLCAELIEKDVSVVKRVPTSQLAYMRMRANECHANARWYAKNDPLGAALAVAGWWVQPPVYVLHSVVKIDGMLICITPSDDERDEIHFIADEQITWVEDGDIYKPVRNGEIIGVGIRQYPELTMAQNQIVKTRILAGIDPMKAGEFSSNEIKELWKEYVGRAAPFV